MKKMILVLMLGIAVAAVATISPITWKSTALKLGEIKAGESVPLTFEFTNNSEAAIMILEAKGSCGCTQVEYPRAAITPGESAVITATFRSSKTGAFKKNIRITSSVSHEPTYLYFSGQVVE